jgi:hypothetical protein
MIAVMYVVTELLLFAAISLKFGRPFNFTAFEAQRREVNAGDDPFGMADVPARLRIRKEIVHPYLGYVYDPTVERSASPYGISDVSPIQHRSADTVIVGIFGGSFADDIAYTMTEELAEQLKPMFAFTSRSFLESRSIILAFPSKYSKSISSMFSTAFGVEGVTGAITFLLQPAARTLTLISNIQRALFIDLSIGNFLI